LHALYKNFSDIIPKKIVKFKNFINVAYAFDNNYYYITHVSMKSIMINQHENTYIIFHILISEDIYNEQKPVIDDICQEYNNCRINYYKLKNEFKEFSTITHVIKRTTAIYYRLLLQNLLLNETKTLYFDCDTLIYKDLTELYNYNISDKYYIGQYEGKPNRKYGNNLTDFINSGVILINLENLRKDNIFLKMIDFLRKNNHRLSFLDQDAINVVCNGKNGFFPSNYIISGTCSLKLFRKINKVKSNLLLNSQF
jgi:lipopolysaccharide biosynthesis glycosyltransferase